MLKKIVILLLVSTLLPLPVLADKTSDQAYLSRKEYQRSKLELVTKKRIVQERRNFSDTDIDTSTYTMESYSRTFGNVTTTSFSLAEDKEISEWYLYRGGVRELSDADFLAIVGETKEYERVRREEAWSFLGRAMGGTILGAGVVTMVAGAALSASQTVINGGALATVVGFFVTAFSSPPKHYIQPDYALEKIDAYNVALKQRLGLPLDYE